MGLIGFYLGWRTPGEFGTGITYAGIAITAVAAMLLMGGMGARGDDIEAFSLSGAGNMNDHLRRHSQNMFGNFGCVTLMLVAGIGVSLVGYTLQRMVLGT